MSYWSETFAGRPECVSEARRFTGKTLGDAPGVDAVMLVASELATNAVLHSDSGQSGGEFTLHLGKGPSCYWVRVDDAGGTCEPVLTEAEAAATESGRGLALVAALASRWGVTGDTYARGVWAEIAMPKEEFAHE